MSYSNYKDYNDPIKPYVHDSLEMLRMLSYTQYQQIKTAYAELSKNITDYIANQKGEFKGIDANLEKLIEEAKKGLNAKLNFIIYETLRQGASIALSVSGRLKIDEAVFNSSHNKPVATGEARRSSSKTQDINIDINEIQLDISKKSEELAKHRMEKQRIYNEKEFKLSDRVWDLSNGQGERIKSLIKEGINMDCKKLAKLLDECAKTGNSKPIKEYPNMMKRLKGRFPPDTSFAAMRAARNELSELYFTTSIKDYLENPYIEAVQWLLANNRLKMYEEECDCNDIAYEDVYGLGRGIYPIDKVPDRPHVMCLCTIAPITRRKLQKQLEGGMKLGNVPPEDWFEGQNHENNIELIKSKYIETGLKLFHNEKGRALGLASIDIIKEHKWFIDGVQKCDKRAFLDDLHKVNGRALYILAKHTGNMQVEFYSDRGSLYNIAENKIYCNLINDRFRGDNIEAGFKLGMLGFLHETGHWLDSNRFNKICGITLRSESLLAYLKYDTIHKINEFGKACNKNYKPINVLTKTTIQNVDTMIKQEITNYIKKNIDINSVVSDIFGAMTYEEIAGREYNKLYGHGYNYWNYADKSGFKIKAEVIANFFEVFGSGGERMKAINEYFPTTWKYFNYILGECF